MNLSGVYSLFNSRWAELQTAWIISDTHFISEGEPQHGYPSNEEFVKRINSKVGSKDLLIHLGDVGDLSCARQLKGYKILITGNHDVGHTKYQREIVTTQFDMDLYTKKDALAQMRKLFPNCSYTIREKYCNNSLSDVWEVTADNNLFDEVYTGPLTLGPNIILSHEPIAASWALNLHGHDHKGITKDEFHFNCVANKNDFSPINLTQFLKNGGLAQFDNYHRKTIDKATERKQKRC